MDYSYKAFNSKQILRQDYHLPVTMNKRSYLKILQGETDLWNRQDLFSPTDNWYRVQWKPDRAFVNLHRLNIRKFTISLSMQLPLSPLFPLVSSTDSKQSIRTSPGLIFICLKLKKEGKNYLMKNSLDLSSKRKPFLFPHLAFLSPFFA